MSQLDEGAMRLEDAIEAFLSQYKKSSRQTYESVLKYLSTQFFSGNRKINTIESVNMIQFMASVDARPEIKSPASYNKYVSTVNIFFNWCVKMDLLMKNPAKMLKKRPERGSIPVSKAMPLKKVYRLINHAGDWEKAHFDPRPLALTLFLFDTGCRIGGAAGLTRDHLFLDRYDLIDGCKVYQAHLFEKGNADPNIYYFGIDTAVVLRRLLLTHTGKVVFGYKGRSTNGNNLGAYFRKCGKRAKIGNWGPHSMRHAKGHRLAEKYPASAGSRVLNNSEKVFVSYYSPKDDEYIKRIASTLFYRDNLTPTLIPFEDTGTDA